MVLWLHLTVRCRQPKPKIDLNSKAGLDDYVLTLTSECTCAIKIRVVNLGGGKFYIGESDRIVFVRFDACLDRAFN